MKNKKWLTVTNILIFIIILFYILDRYIIPIPAGYEGFSWGGAGVEIEVEGEDVGVEGAETILNVLGFCGGRLTDALALIGTDVNPNGHAFYRYITVVFTHAFIIHLAVNMIGLYFIGNFVEKKIGPRLTIILFFITGILEALITDPLYLLYNPAFEITKTVTAGASGAIFGLMGAGLVICLLSKDKFKAMKKSHKIVLALYGIIFTYLANGELISWTTFAHNIGLIMGIICMIVLYFISPKIKEKIENKVI